MYPDEKPEPNGLRATKKPIKKGFLGHETMIFGIFWAEGRQAFSRPPAFTPP